MRTIDTVYIDGQFVTPHGRELFDLFNPATEERIGQVRLGDGGPGGLSRPTRAPRRPSGSPCSAGCMTPSRRGPMRWLQPWSKNMVRRRPS